jgi:hypothetical protein
MALPRYFWTPTVGISSYHAVTVGHRQWAGKLIKRLRVELDDLECIDVLVDSNLVMDDYDEERNSYIGDIYCHYGPEEWPKGLWGK